MYTTQGQLLKWQVSAFKDTSKQIACLTSRSPSESIYIASWYLGFTSSTNESNTVGEHSLLGAL